MIHIFCLLFLLHHGDSSLQFLKDVWSGKRLCIGEGGYCPTTLKFPGCCKPYVCTNIPKTNKSTSLVGFAEYIDNRCLLPSSVTYPTNETFDMIDGKSDKYSEVQYDFSTSTEAISNVDDFNNAIYQGNNEQHGIGTGKLKSSMKLYNKTTIKRLIPVTLSQSDNVNNLAAALTDNGTEYSGNYNNSSSDYSGSLCSDVSNSSDYNGEYEENNGTTKYFGVLDIDTKALQNNTIEPLINNELKRNTTTSNNTSAEDDDDEWTSSLMDYDRRPSLRKVVTIPPFHIFKSVEVTQINETIETSE